MLKIDRAVCSLILCLSAALASAEVPESIVVSQNRVPAGHLENGVLTLHLELRAGLWHPEAENGPALFVQAIGEAGRPAQVPGPLLRVPVGTTIHVTVANKLDIKATVYGLNTRPGDNKDGFVLPPGESRDLTFLAGAAGTYYYWARTSTQFPDRSPILADAVLNGAFVVDPAGQVPADRVFMINTMIAPADVFHDSVEILTINGKSYPYTERLEYTEGETVRWRVVDTGFGEHPMHLHGAFYQVLSEGDFESETAYPEGERQWVVTQDLRPYHTTMIEWKPSHPGRWLYHCHFQAHISGDNRVPVFIDKAAWGHDSGNAAAPHDTHESMEAMPDMAGLVLAITVKPLPQSARLQPISTTSPRRIDLVIEPNVPGVKSPTFSCVVREGKKVVASQDKSMGPPIVLTRGEPAEITVLNHLSTPTIIHWHGLELDSYYDGVMGGGAGNQVTPLIAPGASFTARFTPNRAGTFIYHSHSADPNQLSGGIYGPLIVLEPGEPFDPERDKVFVVGTHEADFFSTHLTLNGADVLAPVPLQRGVKYRLRIINIAPELFAEFLLGSPEHPASWLAISKDGARLPPRLAKTGEAKLRIDSGETYDFEFQPDAAGKISFQIKNRLNEAKLETSFEVQ